MKKTAVLVMIAVLTVSLLAASCTGASPAATTPEAPADTAVPFTVTDADGRVVAFDRPVEKSIVLYSQLLLTMKCLGVEDERIVGLDSYTLGQYEGIFPGLKEKPTVGKNLFTLDTEKIIDLAPEVVITMPTTFTRNPELEEQLGKVGIKVVALDFDLDDVANVIDVLGKMFGKEARAAEYQEFWFGKIDLVQETVDKIAEEDRVTVYWENTITAYTTISRTALSHEVIAMAGGLNIARDLEGSTPEVDPEWVITQNPDIIIKYPMGAEYQGGFGCTDTAPFEAYRQEMMARAGFDQIKAVREGEIYVVSQIIKTGAFENVAICYLAKVFYPDLFPDLDPAAYLEEMVVDYLGLDWEVMNGVFIYPEPWSQQY